ncbi:acetyl/propionyl/methylcrotonyl-CoA carboxylase subunit alpha [Sphingomonas desiccabilis]|uniref:ATP-grasp domain-containing protein n=1 Tax=Sphingomonas desiccabilis TaxID=429134 RepID=A0A4Q2IRD0_9SPHN|nr:biotin carboxylase N-terminal domain-containing protein [Sphingomonas desiccabilis]MBB3910977.1 3-methylcrotonyl-CoA carboxylase alpha subunit [Sphingomonas desiccabilis]RXZ32202.1 ATP-grasp domain-containing protein [Sphingomonas desiccabilis]
MIQSLLIANRGEIACRIIGTARRLGIHTIAVYSEADADARHVRLADAAMAIGPAAARESYLVGERILAAARESGAEAIHPGYGFLSENADFAEAVVAAGLVWIGPNAASIRAMGLKDAAKQRMIDAGVPVTPGYLGEDQSAERLAAEAQAIGYPVLIKAVAGGGGKGMRRVDDAAHFAELLQSCRREAASAFGDDRVLIEKYILSPRHIEVQVFGDTHGNVVHLFERDCSLQRRHQKVIEEAPAPGMDSATREALCAAAVRAAKAVDYVGAGTIEFIADGSEGLRADRIWFMEMNTRLQVEHPVTEEITGQDLVEWQLRVASGEPLPKRQDELSIDGWAMEARLYAENPATGFLPSTGRLDHLDLPQTVRIETGVEAGDTISPYYDPMIAKLVASAPSRSEAIAALADACEDVECEPVRTNAWFLKRLLDAPKFQEGDVTTGFIAAHLEALCAAPVPSDALLQYAADDLAFDEAHVPGGWDNPAREFLQGRFGFRLNAPQRRTVRMLVDGAPSEVVVEDHALWFDTMRSSVTDGSARTYFEAGAAFTVAPYRVEGARGGAGGDGALLAPMPGRITAVEVGAGDLVIKGQRLMTLEAMKMEHGLVAPFDGTIAELPAAAGAQVREGSLLVRVEREEG